LLCIMGAKAADYGSHLSIDKFDPSTDNPKLEDFQSVADIIHTCQTKNYAKTACMSPGAYGVLRAERAFKQRSWGPLKRKLIESDKLLTDKRAALESVRQQKDELATKKQGCMNDQISKKNSLDIRKKLFDKAQGRSAKAATKVVDAEKEVARAEKELEAAKNKACWINLACRATTEQQVQTANEKLNTARSAKIEAEATKNAARTELAEAESELEAAEAESETAPSAFTDAGEALKAGEQLLATVEGDVSFAVSESVAASAAWEGAGFCMMVTGGGCAGLVMGAAVIGTTGFELYSLKLHVDTIVKSLTKAEATLEKLEEAFKQTVAFSKLYPLEITEGTWTDMAVLLKKQQHRTERMSALIKDTIAQVINADSEYDANLWCSWVGWGCGSRVPDKALRDLNVAQTFLDSWNQAVGELADCAALGPDRSNSCSTTLMSSIKAEKTAMEGACTNLKKAACDWADARLDPEYCSQSCNMDERRKKLASAANISTVSPTVSLVAVHDAPSVCSKAKKSVDISNKLADAITMATMAACLVIVWAAVRRDGKQDGTMLRSFHHLFPTFLGAASGYFWQLSSSALQANEYLETSLVKGDGEPMCRHILFYHHLPSWLPTGPQAYVMGFVIFVVLGLLPVSLIALSRYQKPQGLPLQMPMPLAGPSRRSPDPQSSLASRPAPCHLVS